MNARARAYRSETQVRRGSTVRVRQRGCKTCKSTRSLVNFVKRRDDYGGFTEGRLCRNFSIASGGRRRAARAKARTQSTRTNCGSVRLDYRLHWAAHAILVAIPGYSCTRPWSSKLSRAWKSNLGEA